MSSSQRKLYQEIDKSLKKVREGIQDFDQIYTIFEQTDPTNQTYREKLEIDINKQIKKLQKQREQIKTWLSKEDVKDREAVLLDTRKSIEHRMETAKVVEKMVKLKKFSTQALANPDMAIHPKDLKKFKLIEFLQECIDELSKQREMLEGEIEQGNDDMHTEHLLERHIFNIVNLENILKLINTDGLDVETVEEFKDDIQYYVDNNMEDPDFIEYDTIYEDLGCEVFPNENGELDVTASTSIIGSTGGGKESTPFETPSVEGTPQKPARKERKETSLSLEPSLSNSLDEKYVLSKSNSTVEATALADVSASVSKTGKVNQITATKKTVISELENDIVLPAVNTQAAKQDVSKKLTLQTENLMSQKQNTAPFTPTLGTTNNVLSHTIKKPTPTPISTPKLSNATPLVSTPQTKNTASVNLQQFVSKREQNTTTSIQTSTTSEVLSKQVDDQIKSDLESLSNLMKELQFPGLASFLETRKDLSIPKKMDSEIEEMLKYSLLNSPDSLDADFKMFKNDLSGPHPTSIFFPQQPLQFLDNISLNSNQSPASQLIFTDEDKMRGFLKLKPLATSEGIDNWNRNISQNDSYSSMAVSKIATKFEPETLFFIFYHYQDSFEQFVSARELKLRGWMFEKGSSRWYKQESGDLWNFFDFEDDWKVKQVGNYEYNSENFEALDFLTEL